MAPGCRRILAPVLSTRLMTVGLATAALFFLAVHWPSATQAQDLNRLVLVLYSYEREFAPHRAFSELFLQDLSRSSGQPVDYVEISLQAARVSQIAPGDATVTHVQTMLAGRQPDLVVPIGGPAAVFAQRNRHQLFPSAPMLLAGVDRRFVKDLSDHDAAVAVDHEPERLVENILTVLPDTKTIFVIVGASHLAKAWLAEMKPAFRRFESRVTFSWANELSFGEMLTRSAGLPPHSAILFAILSVDAEGVPHVEDRALTDLSRVANAPVFGVRSTQLGRGIVGGRLLSMEDLSRNTTRVALRLLDKTSGGPITTPTQTLAAPEFDWRELRRWGIDESRLPPGSTVRFREPTAWERYKRSIVVFVAIAAIQAMLVAGLVVNLTRQRRGQRSLRASEARFRQLSDTAPVILWTSGPDSAFTHVNHARLEFTGRTLEAELGNGWSDAVHADDVARWVETYTRAFERREPFRAKYRLRRHDGEYRWILDTAVPRVFADGSFAGYIGSGIDVTDLELAKSCLSNLSRRLMHEHEQERAMVARALTDDLCQQLTLLMIRLHEFSQAPGGADDGQIRTGVEEVGRQLATLSSEIFAMSDHLRSSKLDTLGLAAATRVRCRELSAVHGVTIDAHDEGIPPYLPEDISLVLFRVIEEAVHNALRHAAARRVTVSLYGGPEIQLEVADDGVGFDPQTVTIDRSLGLAEMRERLHLVDGECTIESRPGAGTRVRVRVPLHADVHSAAV